MRYLRSIIIRIAKRLIPSVHDEAVRRVAAQEGVSVAEVERRLGQ